MTPKEKAKELFDKLFNAIPNDEMGDNYDAAKQCALIAVDEIIKFISDDPYYDGYTFFKEVKQEIEKL